MTAQREQPVAIRVLEGYCDQCGKHFTSGLGVREISSDLLLVSLCIWCTLVALDMATNFEITEQVISWTTAKEFWKEEKRKGFSARDRTPRYPSAPSQSSPRDSDNP